MSRSVMQDLARHIENKIGKKYGFALLVFDYGESGRMNYAANAQREDIIAAMKEFIAQTEDSWGTHKL